MAVRGLIRPMGKSPMLVTGIRCVSFAPPEFLLGELPQEVGAVRWGSWVWGATVECASRGRHMPALISAGTRGQLPSQPGTELGPSHRSNPVLSAAKLRSEARP